MVGISSRDSGSLMLQSLHQLVFHPPRTSMTRIVEHEALNLRKVFQEPRLTPLSQGVVRTIPASVLEEKRDVFGAVSLVIG